MHGITLQVLIKALRRYQKPSRITIHAADEWVMQMLLHQLPAWELNGFTNAKRGADQIPGRLGAAGKISQNTYNHDRSGTARVQCLAAERDGENGKREIGCLKDLEK